MERQTLLFSATMPKQLVQFTRAGLRDPQFVRLEAEVSLSEELRLAFLSVRSNEKVRTKVYAWITHDVMYSYFKISQLLNQIGVRVVLMITVFRDFRYFYIYRSYVENFKKI